jgi:cell division transport system permease protein
MIGLLHQHGHALRLALRRLAGAPLAHLLTIVVIALSLALPNVLFRIVTDLSTLARVEAGPPALTVFMRVDAGEAEIRAVRTVLEARTDLSDVRYVSPAEALRDMQRRTGLDDVLAGLDRNPLPPAFVVRPQERPPEQLVALQAELRALSGVELVQLDAEWARRLYALSSYLQKAVLLLAGVLMAGVVTVMVNTLRLQILASRDEIEVCKLMGASNAFVRRPFLYFGILQMLLGAGLGLAGAELARLELNQLSIEVLGNYGLHFQLHAPTPEEFASVLGFAALVGWLAAAGSVWIFLHRLRPH